jgi:hypothetical protein
MKVRKVPRSTFLVEPLVEEPLVMETEASGVEILSSL